MTEKYIDLKPQIVSDYALVGATAVQGGVGIALEWIDRHPDQVPGRTITESKLHDVQVHNGFSGTDRRFRNVVRDLGITVVPDPGPTNAEKLKAVLDAIGDSTAGYREHLASKLDAAGVKAPGGDDDH